MRKEKHQYREYYVSETNGCADLGVNVYEEEIPEAGDWIIWNYDFSKHDGHYKILYTDESNLTIVSDYLGDIIRFDDNGDWYDICRCPIIPIEKEEV